MPLDTDFPWWTYLGICLFYLPVAVAILYNSVVLWQVIRYLHTIMNKTSQVILNRLKLYPVILIVCWAPGVVYRVTMLFGENVFLLLLLHTIMAGLPGFLNFIAYGLQKQVNQKMKGCLSCC